MFAKEPLSEPDTLIEDISDIHYSMTYHSLKDLPNQGMLENLGNCFKVMRLLQAFDFISYEQKHNLKIKYQDQFFLVKSYTITQLVELDQDLKVDNPLLSTSLYQDKLSLHYVKTKIEIEVEKYVD